MNTIKKMKATTMETNVTSTDTVLAPEVVRATSITLRSFGVRRQDLEEGIAEVQTQALEHVQGKALPASVAEWTALCVTIARNWRLNEKEKEKTRKKYDAGLCEEPDERLPLPQTEIVREPVDARRMVRVLEQQFDDGDMPPRGDEILDGVQAGMGYEEIGAELGIGAEAVRSRLRQMRKRFIARLALLGMTVTLLLLIMLAAGPGMIALQEEPVAPPVQVPELPPRWDVVVAAGNLRAEAALECARHRWEECAAQLDEARDLDPAGETRADVVALRVGVDAGLADEVRSRMAKPGAR